MAAQQPDITRTDLQQHDLSVPGHEVGQARVDIGPTAPFVSQPRSTRAGRRRRSSLPASRSIVSALMSFA